jgi:hypothetical protein
MQPLRRGWARYFTWLRFKRTPAAVISSREVDLPAGSRRGGASKLDFWNESGVGREKLLEEIFALLDIEGWRYSADTGWKHWDVLIYGNFWWSVTVGTVTEYHGGPKCLTRVRLNARMVTTTFLAHFIVAAGLLYRWASQGFVDGWLLVVYGICALTFAYRAWRLKARIAELVLAAATRCDLVRVSGDRAKPKASEEKAATA